MITKFATPSVCVIDDDEKDFRPILDALNSLYVSCVHIKGDDTSRLPPKPFKGLRLVFTDLFLSSSASGKAMASHTANVFCKIVSTDTAPVVVVIWSKHANDKIIGSEIPTSDEETEAELFKRTLLSAQPEYDERLIFVEMVKPDLANRPAKTAAWISKLKTQIRKILKGQEAVQTLWAWELLVREANIGVIEGLTSVARLPADTPKVTLENGLKETLQHLARAQGGADLSHRTASMHLTTVLAQLLADKLEHTKIDSFSQYGKWLNTKGANAKKLSSQMNGFLLATEGNAQSKPFMPGMIYCIDDDKKFKKLFGVDCASLATKLYKPVSRKKDKEGITEEAWCEKAKHVLIEISPACDVAQGKRPNVLLIAGLILPSNARQNALSEDAFHVLPNFSLRWPADGFAVQEVFLMFCSRYKATLSERFVPKWLKPWFRLRELPTAAIRNWYASQSSRVGYVSL